MFSRKILTTAVATSLAITASVSPAMADDGGSADIFGGSTSLSSAVNTGSSNLDTASSGVKTGSTNLQGLSTQGADTAKSGSTSIKGLSSDDKDGEGDGEGISPILMIGGALVLLYLLSQGGFSNQDSGNYSKGETFSGSNGED